MNILFWNLARKDLRDHVCEIAKASSADVVALIESKANSDQMLQSLQSRVSDSFHRPTCTSTRFQLFCRDADLDLSEIYDGNRVSLRRFSYAGTELILGLVHVVDKRNCDEMTQFAQVMMLAKDIQRKEAQEGHSRTILIGDFNMNPFDDSMNKAAGLNAMMTRKCVERSKRTVQGVDYEYFFNPMWGLLGDRPFEPPGTYYHDNSSTGHYGWNLLDQVLVRPSALDWYEKVRIVTEAGSKDLRTRSGRPRGDSASDHFPVLLTLKERRS